jgi:hypothetical protein
MDIFVLLCSDDVNTLDENKNCHEENSESLLQDIREVYIELNAEKTKYIVISRHENS